MGEIGTRSLTLPFTFSLKHTAHRHTHVYEHTHTCSHAEDQKHRMKYGLLQA